MKITILDGNPEKDRTGFYRYLNELVTGLQSDKHQVKTLTLRDMEIKFCTGCWSCWWGPTPGECVFKDESHTLCREYINSDFVIFASPVILGFTSALLKKTQDKLIPLLHPYIELVQGECHHKKRYDRYPGIGLILDTNSDTDEEDITVTTDMFHRFALNLKTELAFSLLTDQPVAEVQDAINRI
ncbi:MAG: flavodoxin family protein [Candidatus Aminicenantes bacterium]|nr:flavodoxin family protein [Candidatus Aminicenantes bacterium]